MGVSRCSERLMLRKASRMVLIGSVASVASVAVLFPLSQAQSCEFVSDSSDYARTVSAQGYLLGEHRPSWVPLLGSFLLPIIASTVLLINSWRTHRNDAQKNVTLHWAWLYTFALSAQATGAAAIPWLFIVCPSDIRLWYLRLRAASFATYAAQIIVLAQFSLVHLACVGCHEARRRGKYLILASMVCAAIACAAYLFDLFVDGYSRVCCARLFQVCAALSSLMFIAFHCNAIVVLGKVVTSAGRDAEHSEHAASHRARKMMLCMVLSCSSTALWLIGIAFDIVLWKRWTQLFYEVTAATDVVSNVIWVLCFADAGNEVTDMSQERKRHQILATMRNASEALQGPACTLAALFEGVDAESLLDIAISRFRCISWDVLKKHPELIVDAAPLDGTVAANDYHLSRPCKLASCDAFWSHSWHDDGSLKWKELRTWCEEFMLNNGGRAPNIWFDRVCVDQRNIVRDLQCLPIFIAGCNHLLVTCGHTYTSRLWCCVELFVYMSMLVDDETKSGPIPLVRVLGRSDTEKQQVIDRWHKFDITLCDCFSTVDKVRILNVVETCGGSTEFNVLIRKFAHRISVPDCIEGSASKRAFGPVLASSSTLGARSPNRTPSPEMCSTPRSPPSSGPLDMCPSRSAPAWFSAYSWEGMMVTTHSPTPSGPSPLNPEMAHARTDPVASDRPASRSVPPLRLDACIPASSEAESTVFRH